MSASFEAGVYFNGYEFFTYNEMAEFLIENYVSAINLVKNNTLFDLIKEGSVSLYEELYNDTKEFEYCENVVTYIIYRLSSKPIFVTKNYRFETTYEMALAIKRSYPDINNDVLTLLKERVLSKIYWNEYLFTKDPRHKRNHDFILNVEENSKYIFSYYYFFILHLPNEEQMNFIINNIKFSNIDELTSYMYTNQKYLHQLIKEIKTNFFVLGLLASKTSINSVASALSSENYLDFLYLITTINLNSGGQSYDFTTVLHTKMSVWLFNNYQNYSYETSEARNLLKEYSMVVKKDNISFLEMFTQVKYLDELYEKFLSLYHSDRIIETKSEIIANSDEFHLGYLNNDEIVCSRYLQDFDLIKTDIYATDYVLSQEKSLVITKLNKEQAKLEDYNDKLFEYYNIFDKKRYNLINSKFAILALLVIFSTIGFLLIFVNRISYVSEHEEFFTNLTGVSGLVICVLMLIVTIIEQSKLSIINDKIREYNRYNKKINKMKILVTSLRYYKEEVISSDGLIQKSNSIVKKRINLKFLKKHRKFYKSVNKLNNKKVNIKQINFDIISKIGIGICFLPSLIFSNHVLFNIFSKEVTYPLVEEFAVFYLILTFVNIALVSMKKPYRNSFLFFIASIIIAVIINVL